MAFNIFKKKKELDYPEEKASVLDDQLGFGPDAGLGPPQEMEMQQEMPAGALPPLPQMGELPPPPKQFQMPHEETRSNFSQGFVSMDRMIPHMPQRFPALESSMSASIRPPEEEHFEMPEQRKESIFSQTPKFGAGMEKPHVFIRINKYKDVMDSIGELHRRIQDAKQDLEEIHGINNDESAKLKEAAEIILKIEDVLRYLETTFTSPEA